ncbi:MAG: VanZ family protein [Desulfatirhabdiaceae bacterium]|nr:VanZ family protein [Desulfatirhabdiaceae bacterium]
MQSHLRNNLKYWLPVGFYCAAIFIQSAYPSMKQLSDVPYGDKYLHMLGYAILGSLFYRAFRSLYFQDRLLPAILLSIAASTGYGISDEFHQYFVPYRSADIMDVLADMVGSCIGVMAYFLIMERFDIFPKHSWIDKLR